MSQVNFIIENELCKPVKSYETDSGYDVKAFEIVSGYFGSNPFSEAKIKKLDWIFKNKGYISIKPGERLLFSTGVSIGDISENTEIQVRPRSSMNLKRGLLCSLGTVDNGYRGNICVTLINTTGFICRVERYDRIAQLVVNKLTPTTIGFTTEQTYTERDKGGFGSTGK